MKVTLAHPYDGHEPDKTVDVPDREARNLISDGFARLPDSDLAAAFDKVADSLPEPEKAPKNPRRPTSTTAAPAAETKE